MLGIDFETRSECDIKTAGAWKYACDPTTEVQCLAFCIADGPVKILSKDELTKNPINLNKDGQELLLEVIKGTPVRAFNSFFEFAIWENILVKRYGWPKIPISQWRCTMSKALAHSLPRSLANVSSVLKLSTQKDMGGYRLMMKMCKPLPMYEKTGYKWQEEPEDYAKLEEYCMTDVETERLVDKQIPDLNEFEQYIWFLDQLINSRGVCVDKSSILRAKEFIASYKADLEKEVFALSEGCMAKVSQRAVVLEWMKEQGVDLENLKKKTVTDTIKKDTIPEHVRRMLELRLELGLTSLAKYDSMLAAINEDSRIKDIFIYHGASTGRWAGKLIQLHNLPKGSVKDTDQCIEDLNNMNLETFEMFYPDVMTTLSSCIRGMIVPTAGHDFIIADYNAIEARVLFWLADEAQGIQKFKDGSDLYVDMARVIYAKQDISKAERQLGKAAILGAGYGMGHKKFQETCNLWGMPVDELLAKKAIDAYRAEYVSVKQFWYSQERAAMQAVKDKSSYTCGKISWIYNNGNLYCQLPSGRRIVYNEVALEEVKTSWDEMKLALCFWHVHPISNKWSKTATYGGKIVENITQAVARDILANAMLQSEVEGYKVAFSVHDEIVSEVPEGFGTVAEFERIITTLPQWAGGCPIKAEGLRTRRYKK